MSALRSTRKSSPTAPPDLARDLTRDVAALVTAVSKKDGKWPSDAFTRTKKALEGLRASAREAAESELVEARKVLFELEVDGPGSDVPPELSEPDLAQGRFQVQGFVTDAKTGRGVPNARVVALDRDGRKSQELGEARTDVHGTYRIPFGQDDFKDPDGVPELQVEVRGAGKKKVGGSEVARMTRPVLRVDLKLDASALPDSKGRFEGEGARREALDAELRARTARLRARRRLLGEDVPDSETLPPEKKKATARTKGRAGRKGTAKRPGK